MSSSARFRFVAFRCRRGFAGRAGNGFTLIELMITVAIIALLASIAYPAYTDSILKGRRAEGRTALIDLLQQQERYLTQTGSYMRFSAGATGTNGEILGPNNTAVTNVQIPFQTTSGERGTNGAYRLGAELCPVVAGEPALDLRACVRLRAEPNGADDEVNHLLLWSTGARTCTGSTIGTAAPKCWR